LLFEIRKVSIAAKLLNVLRCCETSDHAFSSNGIWRFCYFMANWS